MHLKRLSEKDLKTLERFALMLDPQPTIENWVLQSSEAINLLVAEIRILRINQCCNSQISHRSSEVSGSASSLELSDTSQETSSPSVCLPRPSAAASK